MAVKGLNLDALHKFIKRYENSLTSRSKEIRLPIEEAGLISAALNSLLIEKLSEYAGKVEETLQENIEIRLDAGSFTEN